MELKVLGTGMYNAKVNDLYNQDSGVYLIQGVKKGKQSYFESSIRGRGNGSNGSYLMHDEKVTYTFLKLYVYDLQKVITIDVRGFLKEKYNDKRLTKRFLAKIRANMPKKIKVQFINNIWVIVDYNSLQIRPLT